MNDEKKRGRRPGLTSDQQALVVQALPKLRMLVDRIARKYPNRADEIRSTAAEALSRRARTYDRSKNKSFDAYWWRHVRSIALTAAKGRRPRAQGTSQRGARAGLKATESLRDDTDVLIGTDEEFERHLLESGDAIAFAYTIGEIGDEEILDALRRAIAALPPQDRRIAELRLLDQRPAREVAELLGISKSTLDRRCSAIRKQLRETLEAQGMAPEAVLTGRRPAHLTL